MSENNALNPKRIKELEQLCHKLGVLFGRLAVLNEALTHSSFAAESPGCRDYERLEFFGDSVLRFVVSEYLLERFPDYDEGQLTAIRSVLVSDKTLAEIAQDFGLSKYILLGRQVQMRPSIMARSMEAIFGAVYNDLGLFEVQNLVLRLFGSRATEVDKDEAKDNHKAQLQEYSQGGGQGVPVYTVDKIEGPPHEPIFSVSVALGGNTLATGCGTTKKAAEQMAAKAAVEKIGVSAQKKSGRQGDR
ncbi:MAG: ribonuclease III [Candidatus Melainabacteria bacterium]|nr:ribonuclease III [Candidatus Melainabacteria bacterium]